MLGNVQDTNYSNLKEIWTHADKSKLIFMPANELIRKMCYFHDGNCDIIGGVEFATDIKEDKIAEAQTYLFCSSDFYFSNAGRNSSLLGTCMAEEQEVTNLSKCFGNKPINRAFIVAKRTGSRKRIRSL
ncbi:hypothetical protein [Selenomonas ruminantium]|uniref:hypothetical protein n=1 Tax=Selenomonas ruminantium TaxID=971 RepID=UPI0026EC47C5|nr:hypothetical protein [Selenomonas ruminantium]